jgi:hypothetical protein
MAAFASWLCGDGAKAWCALDHLPADQSHSMAALVAGALDAGLPPSEWEHQRNLITGLAAGLDESYTPGTTVSRSQDRPPFSSQQTPGQHAPER